MQQRFRLGLAVALALTLLLSLAAPAARAGCCRLVRLDPPDALALRVCENDGAGGCGTIHFEGDLAQGATQSVCSVGPTLVYQEWELATASFGPPVTARCDGNDVEL